MTFESGPRPDDRGGAMRYAPDSSPMTGDHGGAMRYAPPVGAPMRAGGEPEDAVYSHPTSPIVAPPRGNGGNRGNRGRARDATTWLGGHKKSAAGIAVAVVLVVLLVAVLASKLLNPTPTVTVYTVHTQPLTSYVGGGGLTYPLASTNIVYPVNVGVLKVNVQVGQTVKAGQLLMQLNSADLEAQLQRAQAQVSAAQTYLNGVLSTPNASPALIAQAQSSLEQAQALYSSLASQINSPEYNNGNLVAPYAGVVTAVNATSGTVATANTTLVTVAVLSSIIVKVEFPIEQVKQVQLKQTADVYPAAAPDQHFTGIVTNINPQLTSPGADTFEAWVTVDNSTGALFVGESVYARVQGQQSLPTVPEVAVVNPDADSIVFLYSNGRAHLQHVVVGVRDGNNFGISSGLQDGDEVIIVGQYQLTDNEKVKVRTIEP